MNDFNCSLSNLGWDVQSLEERSLLRAKTCVLGWHDDIQRSQSSGTSWGTDLVGEEKVADVDKFFLGEDKADVALDVLKQLVQLGIVSQVSADGLSHHGVLSHEYNGMATERNADLLHLLGTDIVCIHLYNEAEGQRLQNYEFEFSCCQ